MNNPYCKVRVGVAVFLCSGLFFLMSLIPPVHAQGQGLVKENPQARILLNRGLSALQNEDLEQAHLNLQLFLDSYPESPLLDQVYYGLARLSRLNEDNGAAVFYYEKLMEEFPASELTEKSQTEMALALIAMGNFDGAIPILERKYRLTQDLEDRMFLTEQIVDVYIKKKDHVQAVNELMRKAWPAAEDRGPVREKISDVLRRATPDELSGIAKRFSKRYPGDQALMERANRFERSGERFEAEREYRRFLSAFPEHRSAGPVGEKLKAIKDEYKKFRHRIGVLLPLSGKLDPFGRQVLNGIRLAVEMNRDNFPEENFAEIVVRDVEDENTGLLGGLDELVKDYKVGAIIGPLLSRQVVAMGPRVNRYKVPLFAPAAAIDKPFASDYLIRTSVTLRQQVDRIVGFAVNDLELPRFAVVYPDDRYGKEMLKLFREAVNREGGQVMASASYPPEANDFGPTIRQLRKMDLLNEGTFEIPQEEAEDVKRMPEPPGPSGSVIPDDEGELSVVEEKPVYTPGFDAVFLPGDYDKVGLLASHLAFHDIQGVALLGTNGWNSSELVRLAGRYIEGGIFVDGFFSASTEPAVLSFVESYRLRYREEPTILAAQAFDTTQIVFNAILGGAEEGKDILRSVQGMLEFSGATGRIHYSDTGEMTRSLYVIQVKNGRFEQIN